MPSQTRTTRNSIWTVDPERVREAALSIVVGADALIFAYAAVRLGVPGQEAEDIAELLEGRQKRSHGCI